MCGAALLLNGGRCIAYGNTHTVRQEYLRDISRTSTVPLVDRTDRSGSGEMRFVSLTLESSGDVVSTFQCGMEAVLHLKIENRTEDELRKLRVALDIDNELGQRVVLDTRLTGDDISGLPPGPASVRVVIPRLALLPGRYRLTFYATLNGIVSDWLEDAAVIDVEPGDYFGTGNLPAQGHGVMVLLDHEFIVHTHQSQELFLLRNVANHP